MGVKPGEQEEGKGEGEELERWLELLCFLSSLLNDKECRTHFTEILVGLLYIFLVLKLHISIVFCSYCELFLVSCQWQIFFFSEF